MAKHRALSITAAVRQTAVDTDGKTQVTQTFNYYFDIELFIRDCIMAKTSDFDSLKHSKGTNYYGGDGLTFWETVDGILADASEAPSTITNSSSYISDYSVTRLLRDQFRTTNQNGTIDVLYDMVSNTSNFINQYLRYLILSLSDEAFENLIGVWKDRIVKTVNSLCPDLPSEVTLSYTNTHTTE